MGEYKRLWWILLSILAITFGFLGYFGKEVYRQAPPIPIAFVSEAGEPLMTKKSILDGQTAWQSIGGMQLGSIWGHGAYQAPDWTADWLHRELLAWLNLAAKEQYGQLYEALTEQQQHNLQFELKQAYRTNSYNVETGTVVLSNRRIQAI